MYMAKPVLSYSWNREKTYSRGKDTVELCLSIFRSRIQAIVHKLCHEAKVTLSQQFKTWLFTSSVIVARCCL